MATKIIQKYARAAISSNLKSDEHHHDTDTLSAVALSSDFGSLLFRVKYANDATSFPRLTEEWRWYVKKRAAVAGWPIHIKDEKVADTSIRYWQNDICPVCGGKGVKKMEFVEILSDDPCDTCQGTGKKPLVCDVRIHAYVLEMVCSLDAITINAGSEAIKKLANDMDLP